jgi:hypothetical protein
LNNKGPVFFLEDNKEDFMIRYLISAIVFFAGVNFTIYCSGLRVLTFVDVPTFILNVLVPLLFAGIVFGFKDMKKAFSAAFKKDIDNDRLKRALDFFNFYGKAVLNVGVIGVVIGVIGMFVNLEDVSQLGPNMAVSILSMYYGCIMYVIVVLPFTIFIKKKLKE